MTMRKSSRRTIGRAALPALALAGVLAFPSATASAKHDIEFPKPTAKERLDYVRRARVWEPTDVAAKNLYDGPTGRLPYAVDAEVSCEFVPKRMSGWSSKFACRLDNGTVVKVKYDDGGPYKEVFGEVLGTRLFWALGFYADRMLPVRMTCHGCPEHPFEYVSARKKRPMDADGEVASFPESAKLGTYTFELAAVEEKLDSETIETKAKQGWPWSLLDQVDEAEGGATHAEVDALRLLNAFVQNADNKAAQNTLACPRAALRVDGDGAVTCERPVMYVDDLGSVFGKGGFTTGNAGRVDYDAWKGRRVWRDKDSCRARLSPVGGDFRTSTLKDPVVGEEGRLLLAKQLDQLSDAQIADLFRAARIEKLHQTLHGGDGAEREVTIDDWVTLFKAKRSEITEHAACPSR
jgi:hypothetical protein